MSAGRARLVYGAKLVLIAGCYYASAKLGLDLAFATSSVTAIWPPTGSRWRRWCCGGRGCGRGWRSARCLANAWTGVPLLDGARDHGRQHARGGRRRVPAAAGRGLTPALERVRDVVALVVLAARCQHDDRRDGRRRQGLVWATRCRSRHFGSVWRTWWLGDMGGDLLVAPLLLAAVAHWPFNRPPGRAWRPPPGRRAVGSASGLHAGRRTSSISCSRR